MTLSPHVAELAKWVVQSAEAILPGPDNFESRLRATAGAAMSLLSSTEAGAVRQPTAQEKNLTAHLIFGLTEKQDGRYYRPEEVLAALLGAADGMALAAVEPRE